MKYNVVRKSEYVIKISNQYKRTLNGTASLPAEIDLFESRRSTLIIMPLPSE